MTIAVIIPVFNSSKLLAETLGAVAAGTRPPDELIVVDDRSTDSSSEIAEQFGARVIVMRSNVGPAACRNEAGLLAQSEILVFLDADTCVHDDTLQRMEHCLEDPDVTAVIGSYDDTPLDPGLCSQYRNLAHCYVHHTSRREALTFWSGCGAIRKKAFLQARGFNERYRRPSVEDIEFGYQISDHGARIILDPSICVTHTKRWTIWNSIVTDIFARGTPWMLLLFQRRKIPNDLNITLHHRVASAFAGLSFVCLVAAALWSDRWIISGLILALLSVAMETKMLQFIYKKAGMKVLAVSILMTWLQNLSKVVAAVIACVIIAWWSLPLGVRDNRVRISRIYRLIANDVLTPQ